MSASVNLPLHHKAQKFSSGTGSPGWPRKKGHNTVLVWCGSLGILQSAHVVVMKFGNSRGASLRPRVSVSESVPYLGKYIAY